MTTVKVRAEIDLEGKLRLEVPVGLPAGNAEVLIVVQHEVVNGHATAAHQIGSARSGLFAGGMGQSVDVDVALNEINGACKSKLSDLS